ncbi:MAG: gamma-glutamylcyclotransferase [Dictyoglomaceae bacterium]|nr:gamma-glutamylcyclotransferase [Dictyoglomaceae bacterium]
MAYIKFLWYSGILPQKGSKVVGEVYNVDDVTLKIIDNFEGEGDLYERKKVMVTLEDGKEMEVWTYVYLKDVKEENYIPFEEQPWRE